MPTFCIQTLGCKVNHYETDQMAAVLRSLGWADAHPSSADVHIINTCSVTTEAASKSRQIIRRSVRLPLLRQANPGSSNLSPAKVLFTGCWATSDKQAASQIPGVADVITHHDDVAARLRDFAARWDAPSRPAPALTPGRNKSSPVVGTRALPLLGQRQADRQRAFLKIQDGCDAHCTLCIIPSLRPSLFSKSIPDAVEEARRLVDAGHVEIVLAGIFLGAYGHETALRRRQPAEKARPLSGLIDALCTQVPGLLRLRLSSIEPGDLDDDLLAALRSHRQVVPHFDLPLQSGSSTLLRRMNRQYTRNDFLRMLDRVSAAFDRPALTTDIIVGFPGEDDHGFEQTLDVVHRARFMHIHAFPFSPRPGTAAARWSKDFVHPSLVGPRIDRLHHLAGHFSHAFRQQFMGQTEQVLVERDAGPAGKIRHGRCERYFDVHFDNPDVQPGDLATVRVDRVTPARTFGTLV
jgi:threonylcarbamoyladenosine tRNA methylthiotransferase MtaB